jgi:UDP-2,4-diacetamido-2,4,6-trideoxy-beta-L-altropyranose hydrolase
VISNTQNKCDKIFIRADASVQIGTGHIMRCIALAQTWQEGGGDVTFLSHCENKALRQRIINEGFDFIPVKKFHPDHSDLIQTLNIMKRYAPSTQRSAPCWLVVDGYHFTQNYHKTIRENGYKLLVIDDLAHLEHYHADIVLNQNIHAPKLNYSCDKDTVQLLGCDYIMLRKEFLKYRNWNRQIPEKAKKILVMMGGSDPDNVTLRVIKILNSLDIFDLEVKVVVGPSNPHKKILKNITLSAPCRMLCVENVRNMSKLMVWSDMAVTAAGSTCWELAFMGVPAITIVTVENQQDVAKGLEMVKIFKTVGWCKAMNNDVLATELLTLMEDKKLREEKSRLGLQLIDGKGTKKIIFALSEQHALKY